jgi:hypothetical protein
MINQLIKGGLLAAGVLITKKLLKSKSKVETADINNIVNSINRSKELEALYKKLMIKTHPDRNPEKLELAHDYSERLNKSRRSYDDLKKLELEINAEF